MGTFKDRTITGPTTAWGTPQVGRRDTWSTPAAALPMAFRDPVLVVDGFVSETRVRGCGGHRH